MTIQTLGYWFDDGALQQPQGAPQSCYAEVPLGSFDEQSRLVEQVLLFAFDTLGVRHLDVRVRGADTRFIDFLQIIV
jgi:hypothetical protein